MVVRESKLEKDFRKEVENRGGLYWKFTSPGKAGVPDRIVVPGVGNQTWFIEVKRPGEKLKPLQQKRREEIEERGGLYWLIDSYESGNAFLQEVFGG